MARRDVVVRLTANSGQFDAAMSKSAKSVKNVGNQEKLAGTTTTLVLYRIKTAAITFATTMFIGAGQSMINFKEQAAGCRMSTRHRECSTPRRLQRMPRLPRRSSPVCRVVWRC